MALFLFPKLNDQNSPLFSQKAEKDKAKIFELQNRKTMKID